MANEKPPLGIEPEVVWYEHRMRMLQEAIARYIDAGWYHNISDFTDELGELSERYSQKFRQTK